MVRTEGEVSHRLVERVIQGALVANYCDLVLRFNGLKKCQLLSWSRTWQVLNSCCRTIWSTTEDDFRSIVDAVVQLELMTDNDLVVTEAQDELKKLRRAA